MPNLFERASSLGRSFGGRDRRALLALAVAGALFLLVDFAVLPWIESAQRLRASLPLKEKTLRKYRQMVALAGNREADWESLQKRVAEAEKGLLESRTPALASAELQQLVKQLMSQQGVEMRGADFLPVRPIKLDDATYTAVPLALSFECRLDQLINFLLAARNSGKTMALDQLSIAAAPPQPDRAAKLVSVRMAIRGLMAAEPALAGGPPPKS